MASLLLRVRAVTVHDETKDWQVLKTNIHSFRTLREYIKQHNVHVSVVVSDQITNDVQQALRNCPRTTYFSIMELSNPGFRDHIYQPVHVRVVQRVPAPWRADTLCRIDVRDPLVRYYGARRNQILHVITTDDVVGLETDYFVVT